MAVIIKDSQFLINQLNELLENLSNEQYSKKLSLFSGSTIGQHFRHILEFYVTLMDSKSNEFCYDIRKRELIYEVDTKSTIQKFNEISAWMNNTNLNKKVMVLSDASLTNNNADNKFPSSFGRELLYAFDHTVHHLAIIKIGLKVDFPTITIPENLGIAPSTLKHKASCAQ